MIKVSSSTSFEELISKDPATLVLYELDPCTHRLILTEETNQQLQIEFCDDKVLVCYPGKFHITILARIIVIQPYLGVPRELIDVYLFGTALGIWMIRRGDFFLHGSTVRIDNNSVMFSGHSGAGKSTTVAWLMQQGWRLVADDVSRLHWPESGAPLVYPGLPHVKLWEDSATALGHDPEKMPRLFQRWNKHKLEVPPEGMAEPAPLSAIFILQPEDIDRPVVEPIHGAERFLQLAPHIYRAEFIKQLGKEKEHFQFCSRLAAAVPVFRLRRPTRGFDLAAVQEVVMAALAGLPEA